MSNDKNNTYPKLKRVRLKPNNMHNTILEKLPVEVLYQIFEKLPVKTLSAVSQVCRGFYTTCQDDRLWRKEFIKYPCLEPKPRLCHTATVWNDSMYVYGGHNTKDDSQIFGEVLDDLWRFRFEDRKWQKMIARLPAKTEHSAVTHNNKLYLFGGYSDKTFTNTLYSYDFETQQTCWLPLQGNNIPSERSAHTGVVYDNKMYIFGGWNGLCPNNDLYVYDFISQTWDKIFYCGTPPVPRCSHAAVVSEKYKCMFIFGGYGGRSYRYLNDICVYNFENNTWSVTQNCIMSPRSRMRVIEFEEKIYLYGGWNSSEHFNNLYQYDEDTGRWQELQLELAGKIGQHSMVIYNNILYIFGGYNSDTKNSTNDLYAYRLSKPSL